MNGATDTACLTERIGVEPLPLTWVGIGASAGGLEALRSFVRHLSDEVPATYIIAQHMAPHHKSLLVEIIGRETSLPVLELSDGLAPRAATIYVTPPNCHALVRGETLHLLPLNSEEKTPKPSVDILFESLARERREHAVGIILSGTGSDGARGIRAISEHGGITVAQDEHTAKYTGMPLAARDSGVLDLVLSPEDLGLGFARLLASPRDLDTLRAPLAEEGGALLELTRLLLQQTRVDFRRYKSATVQRRVERRMAAVEATTLGEYVAIARESPTEVDNLFRDLMITVTSLFRDPEEFEVLGRHVERLIAERRGEKLRVWVAGVATGEEAYSIAILIARALGGLEAFMNAPIQLFATDIDADALDIARRGFYPDAAFAALERDLVEAYFEVAPGGYTIRKQVREKIAFSAHDVTRDPPFLNLDLVSCRNLLIYFQSTLQRQVFERFHYALRDDALLFLGKSEAIAIAKDLFVTTPRGKHVFLQRSTRARKLEGQPFPDHQTRENPVKTSAASNSSRQLEAVTAQLNSLINALGPDALLVSEDARLLKVYGNVDSYVGIAVRSPVDTTVTSLLREPWAQEIRVAVPTVLRNGTVYEGLIRTSPNDENCRTRLLVYPMIDDAQGTRAALVVFRSWTAKPATKEIPGGAVSGEHDDVAGEGEQEQGQGDTFWRARANELTQELDIARNNLQTTIEELETSNEELQATNEEMQSSNEELQSINEELETSSEELQSTNEELSTVNEELNTNAQRLNEVNESQRSILDNMLTPMIVLDRHMHIVDASLSASEYFHLPTVAEQPHVSHCPLPSGFPSLEGLVNEALEQRERLVRPVNTTSLNATLYVAPYYSVTNELSGVVVQLSDNEEAVGEIRNELELIFAHTPAALVLCEHGGQIVNANGRAREWLDLDLDGFSKIDIRACLPRHLRPWLDAKQASDDPAAATGRDTIFALRRADGSARWILMHKVPFVTADGNRPMLLVVLQDVTERHEEALRNEYLRTRMDLALSASDIGTWESDRTSGLIYWSSRTKEIMGKRESFVPLADAFADQVHPDDLAVFENGHAAYSLGDEPHAMRVRIVRDDGSMRWVSIRGRRYTGSGGERVIGTIIDETELIEQLEQLRAKNHYLQLAERLSGAGYWSVNINDTVGRKVGGRLDRATDGRKTTGEDSELAWSEQVYRIHGVDSRTYEPTLQDALAFYHKDDVEKVHEHLRRAVENQSEFEFIARLKRADGCLRTVRSLGQVQLDRLGNTHIVFGVIQDISDAVAREESLRNARDEAARSNEELSRFSYVCSHDMKEPVRLIGSMADMLQEPDALHDPDDARELLGRINRNTKRLSAIIDSLLAYSRAEAKIEFVAIDLNEVIAEIRDNLSLLIEELDPRLDVGPLPVVHGAHVHFMQLFQNLIGNALTYSDAARPHIIIHARDDEADPATGRAPGYIIVVEDNGPGVPHEQQSRIFDVFTRLELSSSVEGSGLGLSICKRIVAQYEGSIVCSDSELGGARFTIRLPGIRT